jgi:hypothetical protein
MTTGVPLVAIRENAKEMAVRRKATSERRGSPSPDFNLSY